jgi:NodT family efflux transporter outer membrane factor (OMF) lipoprotein
MDGFISWLKHDLQRTSYILLSCMILSGCMVGPDYHPQKSPDVKSYNAHPLPPKTASVTAGSAGKSQTYIYGRDIPAEWWQLFHSNEVDQLVRTGIANSPTLAAAQAALRQAEENLKVQIGNLLIPAFNVGFNGTRQRFASSTIGVSSSGTTGISTPSPVFNLFNANVSVSYILDVFGGSRRQVEAYLAQVDYQQFQVLATYLTLTSNIVTTAITVASYESQIKATVALIKAEEGQLHIMEKQYRVGGIADTNVLTQRTLVDQARATLPPLQKSLAVSRHALAVLIGEFPDTPMPSINLDKLHLPVEIPVSLPSKFVKQRPDVRASEALLHVASAQIGVATANLFPQISITGSDGWTSSVLSNLFSPTNKVWLMQSQITQPLFHGGALLAQRRAAIDAYDQALAQYRQVLLQAFQNTADVLRALETDARTFREAKSAERAAYENFVITSKQYKVGGVAYLNLLNAQQQYQQTRIASIQAQAQRYADTVALYQALGGGWWNRKFKQCPDNLNPENASLTCP